MMIPKPPAKKKITGLFDYFGNKLSGHKRYYMIRRSVINGAPNSIYPGMYIDEMFNGEKIKLSTYHTCGINKAKRFYHLELLSIIYGKRNIGNAYDIVPVNRIKTYAVMNTSFSL